ncbi:MAG: energy-coupling factor transporter transmembrane component T [Thermotaleaceae bacterium]
MKVHPFTMIVFQLVLICMILFYMHPLYVLSILCFVLAMICVLGKLDSAKKTIAFSLYNALLVLMINPLVSQTGKTILYRSPRIPLVGRIKITGEALAYGANMGVKLICIFLIFTLFGMLTDRDEVFGFFSKYAHKLTLTLSLTVNIIHRLKNELQRVRDVMILRGVDFQGKRITNKIKAYYPVLKVILISALEGSMDRAEALYSRGYGIHRRTSYVKVRMEILDYFLLAINLLLLFLLGYGMILGRGSYLFYPELMPFRLEDLKYLVFVDFVLVISLFMIWGSKRWKFLKYRI